MHRILISASDDFSHSAALQARGWSSPKAMSPCSSAYAAAPTGVSFRQGS